MFWLVFGKENIINSLQMESRRAKFNTFIWVGRRL